MSTYGRRAPGMTHLFWRLYLRTPRVSGTAGFVAGIVVGVVLTLALIGGA